MWIQGAAITKAEAAGDAERAAERRRPYGMLDDLPAGARERYEALMAEIDAGTAKRRSGRIGRPATDAEMAYYASKRRPKAEKRSPGSGRQPSAESRRAEQMLRADPRISYREVAEACGIGYHHVVAIARRKGLRRKTGYPKHKRLPVAA